MAAKRISATRLAKNTAEILSRVEHKGERFVVERHGKVVARIIPRKRKKKPLTGDELCDFLEKLGSGPEIAEAAKAIEDACNAFPPLEPPV